MPPCTKFVLLDDIVTSMNKILSLKLSNTKLENMGKLSFHIHFILIFFLGTILLKVGMHATSKNSLHFIPLSCRRNKT